MCGFFGVTQQARAVASIAIDIGNDGTFDFVVADESMADVANGILGNVTFIAPTSTGVFSITTGLTAPNLGTFTNPFLALSNITGNGPAGTYAIYFSEVGFGPTTSDFYLDLSFNPTSGPVASVTYEAYSSASNTLFARSDMIGTLNLNTDLVDSAFTNGTAPSYTTTGAPYSLTQKLVITLGGETSFRATADLSSVSVPDGGASLALLGLSLIGLHGVRRKFAKA